jgi:hypothetical protein
MYTASIRIGLEQQEIQFASAPGYMGFSVDNCYSGEGLYCRNEVTEISWATVNKIKVDWYETSLTD